MNKLGLLASNCDKCEHAHSFHYEGICTFCDRIVKGETIVEHHLNGFCGTDNLRLLEYKVKECV